MAEVRVRFPLGALNLRTWGSLASRVFRKHETAGSNPAVLTDLMRWVPCWYGRAAVNRFVAGSILASAAFAKRKGKPIGDGSRFKSGRAGHTAARPYAVCRVGLASSTLAPSAGNNNVLLAERQRLQASGTDRRLVDGEASSTLAEHSWGSANGRPPAFEAGCEGSSPSPQAGEPERRMSVVHRSTRCGTVAVGSDAWLRAPTDRLVAGGRWFDSNFRSSIKSMDGSHPAG